MNDGNFRALLRYRARGGDNDLLSHISWAKANATYHSNTIQNELIFISGYLIKDRVIKQIKDAKCWTILADDTMDRQKREQCAICIRYLSQDEENNFVVKEDPILILDIIAEIKKMKEDNVDEEDSNGVDPEVRLSGEAIGQVLLKKMKQLGLDLNCCIAQGYDGASTMSSERVGVSAVFRNEAPLAHYFHCVMHCLNLTASKAIKVPGIRHAEDIVEEVSRFFRSSAKRTDLLKSLIEQGKSEVKLKKHLTTLCKTRFVERHTAVVTMRELLPYVIEALETMKNWASIDARRSAQSLLNSILQSDFIVGLIVLEKLAGLLLPLTRALQTVGMDLVEAFSLINDTKSLLNSVRSDEKFAAMFKEAEKLADSLDVVLKQPRIARKSVHRVIAVSTSSASDCTSAV